MTHWNRLDNKNITYIKNKTKVQNKIMHFENSWHPYHTAYHYALIEHVKPFHKTYDQIYLDGKLLFLHTVYDSLRNL